MIDFEEDKPEVGDKLMQLKALADLLIAATLATASAEAELSRAKETLRRIQEDDIPELMKEIGLQEITLDTGDKLSVHNEIQCSITEARRQAAHAWLTERGFSGLIKTSIEIKFGRGEADDARIFLPQIEELTRHSAVLEDAVHPQTLKAFLKEQLEDGTDLPQDLFGLRAYSKAKLTFAKGVTKKAKG